MREHTAPGVEHLDLEPVEVSADGTWSPPITGDGTGSSPPADDDADPDDAVPLDEGDI